MKLLVILITVFNVSVSQAAIIEHEADAIYGGFWRDLYKFGPVVIDTVGADLGVFATKSVKMGFSFTTLVGLLSDNPDEDIFDAASSAAKKYSGLVNALQPTDFTYSTLALKFEYIFYEGSTFGFSSTTNLGVGLLAYNPKLADPEFISLNHIYGSLGLGVIIKITNNLRSSFGISYRNDFGAHADSRPAGFENFSAFTIYNHFYLTKF